MRDDFAVFILTHGRADLIKTIKPLKDGNYTGKIYLLIDDEDDQKDRYLEKYDNVIVFNKDESKKINNIDTMDNWGEKRAIIYARHQVYKVAKDLGLKYFLQLDDDFTTICYRYQDGKSLRTRNFNNLDKVFETVIEYLENSGADTVAFAQGGDMIGGVESSNFKKGILRKAMNSFFCKVDRKIDWKGTYNEDVTAYTLGGSVGGLYLTISNLNIFQLMTQSLDGGISDAYKEYGTYLKSFYSVMAMPSAVSVGLMGPTNPRLHHRVSWNNCVPKILDERYRKEG